MAYQIVHEFPQLKKDKNPSIRLNHTGLLRAILLHHNVMIDDYTRIFGQILDYMDEKITKYAFMSAVNDMSNIKSGSSQTLADMLMIECQMGVEGGSLSKSSLKLLLNKGHNDARSLAKGAIRELESVVSMAQSMGVTVSGFKLNLKIYKK